MNHLKPFGLYVYALVCGAAVMLIEFAASRMLAPYFGTSIIVWGSIIGVVMIALAAGYYVGGRLADRSPKLSTLSWYVFLASIVTALSPLAVRWLAIPLSQAFAERSSSMVVAAVGSFVAVLFIFALPILLLGMVSPFLIKVASVQANSVDQVGQVAGGLYAWSTIGSIVGTFAGSFVLIPFVGSRETVWIAAAALAVVALVGQGERWFAAGVLLPLLAYSYALGLPLRTNAEVILQDESLYQFYAVVDQGDRYALQYNEGLGTQSMIMKSGAASDTGEYYDYLAQVPYLLSGADQSSVAVLGMAAGTLTGQLRSRFPNQQITGVEIDPAITQLAAERFGLTDQHITIVNDDGRNFLQRSTERYNAIIVDTYSNELYVPWHMATQEFFQEVNSHLSPDGLMAMNIASTSSRSAVLQGLLTTIQSVFPHVYMQRVVGRGNYIVVAAQQPLAQRSSGVLMLEPAAAPEQPFLFTDNRAPVELFTEAMIFDYIRSL